MAKVFYGDRVILTLGRLGDHVYSICRGTPYIKMYQPVVVQPGSDRQQLIKDNFKTVTERWATLSDTQHKLWHQLASLMKIHGDGISSYTRLNCRLLDADNVDLTIIDNPPQNTIALSFVAGLTAVASAPGQTDIAWTNPDNDFEYVQVYWRRHKPNPDNVNWFWSQIVCVRSDDLGYTHNHGLASGRIIYYKARVIDKKGRVSPWTAARKVTTI
jgi:hypothetical protein